VSVFFWNLFLALAWAALKGRVTLSNLIIGFALGYLILLLSRRVMVPSPYFGKVGQLLGFVLHFLWDLIRSNLRVAHDVLTPRHYMRPGVIAVPLDARTDLEILALANRITLTPGTVSLDVSTDRRTLYVHVMYMAEDADATRAALKQDVERRLLEVLR
jgi:multicomponent Na+:H+ antiporter subunit E